MALIDNVELDIDLSQVIEEIGDRASKVVECFYDSAYDNAPVDTGRLRNSITYGQDDEVGYVEVTVDYAPYTEVRGSSAGWFSGAIESALDKANRIWTGK